MLSRCHFFLNGLMLQHRSPFSPSSDGQVPESLVYDDSRCFEVFEVADLSPEELVDVVHLKESRESVSLHRFVQNCFDRVSHVQCAALDGSFLLLPFRRKTDYFRDEVVDEFR